MCVTVAGLYLHRLIDRVRGTELELMQRLFDAGASVLETQPPNATPLLHKARFELLGVGVCAWAALRAVHSSGQTLFMRFHCRQHRVSPQVACHTFQSALPPPFVLQAAAENDLACLEALLARGAAVQATDVQGNTALHAVAAQKERAGVQYTAVVARLFSLAPQVGPPCCLQRPPLARLLVSLLVLHLTTIEPC
jgi:hypothetical protein